MGGIQNNLKFCGSVSRVMSVWLGRIVLRIKYQPFLEILKAQKFGICMRDIFGPGIFLDTLGICWGLIFACIRSTLSLQIQS